MEDNPKKFHLYNQNWYSLYKLFMVETLWNQSVDFRLLSGQLY